MTRDQNGLELRLAEQLELLVASASAFDAGKHVEAARLALSIRVLMHDTAQSHGLLTQVGVKGQIEFPTRVPPVGAAIPLLMSSCVSVEIAQSSDQVSIHARPLRGSELTEGCYRILFDDWWNQHVFVNGSARLTRREIVSVLANKDGGAHVDLDSRYLTALSAAWLPMPTSLPPELVKEISSDAIQREILRLSMRTIAEEVLVAIFNQAVLFGNPQRVREVISGYQRTPARSRVN